MDYITRFKNQTHNYLDAIKSCNHSLNEEMMIAIKEAGGYWLGFGVESGSQKVLEIMKKNLDLDIAKKNVNQLNL